MGAAAIDAGAFLLLASAPAPAPPSPPPGPVLPGGRDDLACLGACARVAATGAFPEGAVTRGTGPEDIELGGDRAAQCHVWAEAEDEVDDDGDSITVAGILHVLVTVYEGDPAARADRIARLTAVVQDALGGSDLGGATLPEMTLVRRWRRDPACEAPEAGRILQVEYARLVARFDGHDRAVRDDYPDPVA